MVVSTQLKNMSQNGNLRQIGVNIKHIWNHHVVIPSACLKVDHWPSKACISQMTPELYIWTKIVLGLHPRWIEINCWFKIIVDSRYLIYKYIYPLKERITYTRNLGFQGYIFRVPGDTQASFKWSNIPKIVVKLDESALLPMGVRSILPNPIPTQWRWNFTPINHLKWVGWIFTPNGSDITLHCPPKNTYRFCR